LLDATSLEVERVRKGKTKIVDYRPLVTKAELTDSLDMYEGLSGLDLRTGVSIEVAISPAGSVRIDELLNLAFGEHLDDLWITRTRFQYKD